MTKKVIELKAAIKDGRSQADIARLVNKDRRQVGDALKRGHLLVTNSKGNHFLVPKLYGEAFE